MKIATWNINSVRLRLPIIKKLADEANPDIICLQETKAEDQHFPLDGVKALGYKHVRFFGQKSYNGVAILSKIPLGEASHMNEIGGVADHKRHITTTLPDGTALHNFYVPAGADIPDPAVNPSFAHKLRYVEDMTTWSKKAVKTEQRMIIMGDFNIAPMEHDVWSHKQLLKVVSHTPPELERIEKLRDSANWVDVARHFTDHGEKLYSWWSYRNRDWRKSDRGRRLDHIWVTPNLKSALKNVTILKDARDWNKPSDHVPVVVEINLSS